MKNGWKFGLGSLKSLRVLFGLNLALVLLPAKSARSAQVLFVVGNTTLGAGDAAARDFLQNTLKHTLTIKQAAAATTADATGKALVVVSSTVSSSEVGNKFTNVAVPVLSWEGFIYDDMGMTGAAATNFNSDATFQTITIATASHPIAAQLTGTPGYYSASLAGNTWGIPGAAAVKVATYPADASKSLIFAFETGAALVVPNPNTPNVPATAPARRVGFSLGDLTFTSLTPAGKSIFQAAVNWAMNITLVSLTAQPASQSVQVGQTATFSVTAAGTAPITYQWKRNGTNVTTGTGGTTATYTTPATVIGDNGAVYTVEVTNPGGAVTSSGATLNVTTGPVAPVFTTPPTYPFRMPAGQVGVAYSYTVVATGTPAPTYSAQNMPPGLSINPTSGAITGIPTARGLFQNILVRATNSVDLVNTNLYIEVYEPAVIITPATSPFPVSATVGVPFNYTVVATGYDAPHYTAVNLPAGLNIDYNSGAITGTPTTAGTFNTTLVSSNGVIPNSQKTLAFTISPGPTAPIFTNPPGSPRTASATMGQVPSYTLAATGFPAPTFSATGLPPGLTLNPTTGVISGPPTSTGTYTTNVYASNGVLPNASAVLNYSVYQAPYFTTPSTSPSPLAATIGIPFSYTVSASGCCATMTYSAAGLPPGLSINLTSGLITGTPTTTGNYTTMVIANNATSPNDTAVLNFSVATPPAPTISTQPLATTVLAGTAATFTVTATGASLSYQWRRNGANVTTGTGGTTASYTTPATGSGDNGAVYTVVVTNPGGSVTSAGATLSVVSTPAAPVFTEPQSLYGNFAGTYMQAMNYTVAASGSPAPTYSATGLPPGLTLNPTTGVISGTPTLPGTYRTGTVTASNGVLPNATVNLWSDISGAPIFTTPATSPTALSAIIGRPFNYSVLATGCCTSISYIHTGLPPGLDIDLWSGLISGTPTATGNFTATVTARMNNYPNRNTVLNISVASVGITTQPTHLSVPAGQTATFTVTAAGTAPYSYQWKKNGANVTTGTGGTTATYTTAAATVAGDNNAVFTVVVSNAGGSATSTGATLTVTPSPVVPTLTTPSTDPFPIDAIVGTAFSYTVAATGSPTSTYSAAGLPAGLAIHPTTGAITGIPTTGGPLTSTVTATNNAGSATKTLQFTVFQAPTITFPTELIPTYTGYEGAWFISPGVTATGYPPPTFSAVNLPPGLSVRSSDGKLVGVPTQSGWFATWIVASNGVYPPDEVRPQTTITFAPKAPNILTQPASAFVSSGGLVTFSVLAEGTNLTYQWKRNGSNVTTGIGGTTNTYTIPAVTVDDDNGTYTCVVTNNLGTRTTDGTAKLRVGTQTGRMVANEVTAARITATEVVVTPEWNFPDYVFEKDYSLRSLPELELYLNTHKHLPEVPSAAEIGRRGMNMGQMSGSLVKNVEELTLHVISLQKEMHAEDLRIERKLDTLGIMIKAPR